MRRVRDGRGSHASCLSPSNGPHSGGVKGQKGATSSINVPRTQIVHGPLTVWLVSRGVGPAEMVDDPVGVGWEAEKRRLTLDSGTL